jgi:FKBP-type peptidyl-prolyl cis-trans isomerase (trigger factor)
MGETPVARPKSTNSTTTKTRRRATAETTVAATPQIAAAAVEDKATPTPEEVERRAYQLYEARGAEPGAELDDWLRAERELLDTGDANRSA